MIASSSGRPATRWAGTPWLAATLALVIAGIAGAQTPAGSPAPAPTPPQGRHPIWRCETPGGTYEVAIGAILAVSKHEYVVDNAARVTEVNLDTTGNLVVRYYYLEPNELTSPLGIGQSTLDKAQEMLKEATDRTGQGDLWRKVVKSYPLTTHARTVEYRLETKRQLEQVFESAGTAFRTGRGATLKVP